MSWSSGSVLMNNIIDELERVIPDDQERAEVFKVLIEAFEDFDCDNLYDCHGNDAAFDMAWEDIYPEDDEDEIGLDDYFEEDEDYEEDE